MREGGVVVSRLEKRVQTMKTMQQTSKGVFADSMSKLVSKQQKDGRGTRVGGVTNIKARVVLVITRLSAIRAWRLRDKSSPTTSLQSPSR